MGSTHTLFFPLTTLINMSWNQWYQKHILQKLLNYEKRAREAEHGWREKGTVPLGILLLTSCVCVRQASLSINLFPSLENDWIN